MKKVVLLAVVVMLACAGLFYRNLRRPYQGHSGNVVVVIEPGMRAPDVTDLLAARGVLRYRLPFFIIDMLGRPRRQLIKAGEYLFDRPLTPLQVYRKLVQGDVYLRAVLVPEGTDRLEMARIFQQQLGIDPVAFLKSTQATGLISDLDPQAPSLEGFLFPDTYRFPRGASATAVVAAMLARFRDVLEFRFPDLLRSSDKLHDVVTLASLVEKETPAAPERPLVAGVFQRRLEKGMMLQCDPSVVYAVRLDRLVTAAIEGRMNLNLIAPVSDPITPDELQIDSPYNTYTHAGLPRGPICSPGEASLRAARQPAGGQSLYFVSNNQGGHLFAGTLAEHNRNVTRYRRQLAAGAAQAESTGSRQASSGSPLPGASAPDQKIAQPGQSSATSSQGASRQSTPSGAGSHSEGRPSHGARGRQHGRHSGRQNVRHNKKPTPKQEDAHS